MTLNPAARWLEVNGVRLHYLEWGASDAPTILCLHSFTGSARDFSGLAWHLQDRYRIVATDLRGHGESGWSPSGAYEYADQLGDIEAFVDHLEFVRFALVGSAMGGVLAMSYATAHPERINCLVVNDIGPDEEVGTSAIMRWVDHRPPTFQSLDDAIDYLRQASPMFAVRRPDEQYEVARGVLKQAARGRWVWRMDPAGLAQRAERGALTRPPLWERLAKLRCRSLVIWGEESRVLSEAQARRMVQTLPRGEMVTVPNRGHAPTLTEPAALAAIERVLRSKSKQS